MIKSAEVRALAEGRGCLGKSADDEPVFILVARDKFAGRLVRDWADLVEHEAFRTAELTSARKEKIAEARKLAKQMDEWKAHKLPD